MSFLDRIAECNAHDLSHFRPFMVAGQRVGWVRLALVPLLSGFPDVFKLDDRGVTLNPRLKTFAERSAAIIPPLRALEARGIITGWRDEPYPITTSFTAQPLMQMERAAIPHFGVRAYGVHMSGFVRRQDGLHMWVARRARDKPTYPGMLDNTVAGGQPIGIGLVDNLVKECKEEANIPAELARKAIAVGAITYCMEAPDGLKPDVQFCFDLELPDDFTPSNTDGEIEEFFLWPIDRVADTVRDTREFKFNCNLVIIDFLVRHGVIPPDDPDYIDICQRLRQGGSERRPELMPRKFVPQPSTHK
jgi:isopentenyldiphosphate isomerase